MPELSLQNIDQISREISRQGITFSHLLDELIDHVCCDVENEMQNGLDFSEAYHAVKQKMGSRRRLQEIQEETLYAVDTKYRNMKNTMKISGIAGTTLFGFATIFKVMHWPGAGVLLTVGAVTLGFIFLPTALGVLWKESHSSKKLFLFISGFLAAFLFIAGALFKVQHWPYAGLLLLISVISGAVLFIPAMLMSILKEQENKSRVPVYILCSLGAMLALAGMFFKMQHWPLASILMMSGVIILLLITLPWYTYLTWKDEEHVSARFIFIVAGAIAVLIPSAMITLNLQRSFDKGYYNNLYQEQAMFEYLYSNNQALIGNYKDSASVQIIGKIHSKTADIFNKVNDVELRMISESEGKPEADPKVLIQSGYGKEINYYNLSSLSPLPVKDLLLPGTAIRTELESALTGYSDFLSGILAIESFNSIRKLLEPSTCLPVKTSDGKDLTLMVGLHSMNMLKNSLLAAEAYSIKNAVTNK